MKYAVLSSSICLDSNYTEFLSESEYTRLQCLCMCVCVRFVVVVGVFLFCFFLGGGVHHSLTSSIFFFFLLPTPVFIIEMVYVAVPACIADLPPS